MQLKFYSRQCELTAINAKKAYKENITIKEAAMKLKIVTEKEFDRIVDPTKMI